MKKYFYLGCTALLVAVTMPALFALDLDVYGNSSAQAHINKWKGNISADADFSAQNNSNISTSHNDDDDDANQGNKSFGTVQAQARASANARFGTAHLMFIDKRVDNLEENHDDDRLEDKLPKVIDRIDKMLDNDHFPAKFDALLAYLKVKVGSLLDGLDDEDDDNDFDTDLPDEITAPDVSVDAQLLVGGQFSVLKQKLSFNVSGEAMVVSEVSFESNVDDLDMWIDEIGLYDEDSDLIAVGTISDGDVIFDLDDELVGTGSHTRYVGVLLHKIGQGSVGTTGSFMLDFGAFAAIGEDSDTDMDPTITTDVSTTITVASAAVGSVLSD